MDIKTIEITKEEADKEYEEYSKLVKEREEEHLEILKKCAYHLKQGRKVINIFDAIQQGGVDETGEPKLAIARADWGDVLFTKQRGRTGVFSTIAVKGTWQGNAPDVRLPVGFFEKEWENINKDDPDKMKWGWFTPTREVIKTAIPLVPAILMPKGELDNYYILFEVNQWQEVINRRNVGKDPLLLKRLSENMFVILATWDVSPLEQAVLEGLGRRR
jgi:hypothetical protein